MDGIKKNNILEIFDFVIKIEETGNKFYLQMASIVKEEHLQEFFKDMAEEEVLHGCKFKEMKKKYLMTRNQ
ncbi:MAG: hypothetical protein HQK53_09015 [Oligoflexia bacterium]|nr:hypothetical protein [Oligoflexia bacterium]